GPHLRRPRRDPRARARRSPRSVPRRSSHPHMKLTVFGLGITSSWGSGHAVPYRGLLGALKDRGWRTTFFERDVEWFRSNRDLPNPDCCELRLYDELAACRDDAAAAVRGADAVLIGSYT